MHSTPHWPTSCEVLAGNSVHGRSRPRRPRAPVRPAGGYAAIAALAATRRPGIDVVLEFTELEARLAGADLVITGEGSLDEQSLLGKTPWALRGPQRGPAFRSSPSADTPRSTGSSPLPGSGEVHALTELESNVDTCIAEAAALLERLGQNIGLQLAAPAAGRTGTSKESLNV